MPFYYRRRKGPLNFSLSRRGPRVGLSTGCLLSLTVVLVLALRARR